MRNIQPVRDENKAKVTALAQLIQLLDQHEGIKSTADLARRTGYTERAIRKAKTELECRTDRNPGAGTIVPPGTQVPEPECRDGTPVPQTEPECRNPGAERNPGSLAHVEYNNKLTSLEDNPVSFKNPLPPASKPHSGSRKPNSGPTPLQALRAFEAYNATALQCGLPQASKLTGDRQRKIIARLKDFGPEGWTRALANIEKSSFLTGNNDRGFRADLDFLLQAKSFARVHDGGYGNGRHAAPQAMPQRSKFDAKLDAMIAAAKAQGALS